jgi:hypothetical protein
VLVEALRCFQISSKFCLLKIGIRLQTSLQFSPSSVVSSLKFRRLFKLKRQVTVLFVVCLECLWCHLWTPKCSQTTVWVSAGNRFVRPIPVARVHDSTTTSRYSCFARSCSVTINVSFLLNKHGAHNWTWQISWQWSVQLSQRLAIDEHGQAKKPLYAWVRFMAQVQRSSPGDLW